MFYPLINDKATVNYDSNIFEILLCASLYWRFLKYLAETVNATHLNEEQISKINSALLHLDNFMFDKEKKSK